MLSVRAVTFGEIREDWLGLERDGHVDTVFQTFDWAETWWRHLGQAGELTILASYEGQELIGIAPLYSKIFSIKGVPIFRVLLSVGVGESDYCDIICRKGKEESAVDKILEEISKTNCQLLNLTDIPAFSRAAPHIERLAAKHGFKVMSQKHTQCAYIDLPRNYDEYRKRLSKNTRRNLTKDINQAERDLEIQLTKVVSEDAVDNGMQVFLGLHHRSWENKGKSKAIYDPKVEKFHRETSRRLFRYLDLKVLESRGKPIAAAYSYDYQGTRGVYLPGADPEYRDYSLGNVMTALNIKDAIESGLARFDFLRGDESYKRHFTSTWASSRKIILAKKSLVLKAYNWLHIK